MMENQNKSSSNITKFHEAMNALAVKWCRVQDAISIEQATDMLATWTKQHGGNEDLAVAYMCEMAYGAANITLRDAALIVDDTLRKQVQTDCAALQAMGKPTMANVVDIIARHWSDLTEDEKTTIAEAIAGELT